MVQHQEIALLNDEFRLNVCGADIRKSPEIAKLTQLAREEIYTALYMFDNFSFYNNPHPEREFGVLMFQQQAINWQIDYFDNERVGPSPDPCDPALTKRVMSIRTAAETIAHLNDELRINGIGGNVLISKTLTLMEQKDRSAIIQAVRDFDSFDKDKDPFNERDFGLLTLAGRDVFWRIDYYDKEFNGPSPNPCDASVTGRQFTIMLASELLVDMSD